MVQSFAQACNFSIATLQWTTPVPGLGPEPCQGQRADTCCGLLAAWRVWHGLCRNDHSRWRGAAGCGAAEDRRGGVRGLRAEWS